MNGDFYLESRDTVAHLVINRPAKRNAITLAMWRELPSLLDRVRQDPRIRVLVVRGADSTVFSAGADIKELEALSSSPDGMRDYIAATLEAEASLASLDKPTIAMVQGPCIGGGCGIALSCDLRFCDESAAFGITPARIGLVYGLPPTKRLVDLVGPARAKYLLFSGRIIDAERASSIGMVDEVFGATTIEAETDAFARLVASRAQLSVRSTKRMIDLILLGQSHDTPETLGLCNSSYETDDYQEGVRAFLEKRRPRFTCA